MRVENGRLTLEDQDVREIVKSIHLGELTPKQAMVKQVEKSGYTLYPRDKIMMPNNQWIIYD